jgi:hypothetical protein
VPLKKNLWIFYLTDFSYLQKQKAKRCKLYRANSESYNRKGDALHSTSTEKPCNKRAVLCLFYTETPAFIDQY